MICIRCCKAPQQRIQLCLRCWSLTVYGEPDRLPPFPPLGLMVERVKDYETCALLRSVGYPA